MILGGDLWVDARPAAGEVLAFINGRQCGRGQSGRLQSEPPAPLPFFVIEVASDAEQPGCGVPGAAVTITIDGRAMNDAVTWQPGSQQPVSLIAGPAFAQYHGSVRVAAGIPPRLRVVPYINGVVCGKQLGASFKDTQWSYQIVVDPEELDPGCGHGGVDVTLRLEVEGQPDIVLDTVQWETGPVVRRPGVDLSGQILTTPLPTPAP